MKTTLTKHLYLTTMLTLVAAVYISSTLAETNELVIRFGDSTQNCQQTIMEEGQWNDTRQFRQKINRRTEKEWDKIDAAFDSRDKCE